MIDCLEIVDDYIICVRGAFEGNILSAIPLAALEALASPSESPAPTFANSSTTTTTTITSNFSTLVGIVTSLTPARLHARNITRETDYFSLEGDLVSEARDRNGPLRPNIRVEVRLADLPTIDASLSVPPHWLLGRSMLSVCDFHWQTDDELSSNRKTKGQDTGDIAVTVLLDVYSASDECDHPIADFYVFKRHAGSEDDGDVHKGEHGWESDVPNITIRADQMSPRRRAKRRRKNRRGELSGGPRFVSAGRSQSPKFPLFLASASTSSFDAYQGMSSSTAPPPPSAPSSQFFAIPLSVPTPSASSLPPTSTSPPSSTSTSSADSIIPMPFRANSYSLMAPPSQSGIACVAFHDDHDPVHARYVRALALFVPGRETLYCPLEHVILGEEGRRPATYSLNVEHYSGAVYYLTEDMRSVVIKYFG